MKRLLVQEAFVGESNPQQEGLAAWGEQDEAVVLQIEHGRLVFVAPPHTPAEQELEAARFLALELTLEDGRTLTLGIEGETIGVYLSVDRRRRGRAPQRGTAGLSSIWAASA